MIQRVLTVLVLAALAGCAARVPSADGPVVLIVVDTLRSDHLPAYGYRGVKTPHLDRLAADAIVFEHAYSHVPLTLPSHATLLTGQLPTTNGVRNNAGYRLDEKVPTLAGALRARGYRTGGFVSSTVLDHGTGIASGFETYDDRIGGADRGVDALARKRFGRDTAAGAMAWLDGVAGDRFFLFLHLYDPHVPYNAPEPFRTTYGPTYDAEIAYDDAVIGSVIEKLRRKGLYDKALIAVVSDHGEGLGDHGETQHGLLLYRETLQVPLLLKLPGQARAGTRRADAVGLVDVAATIAGTTRLEMDGLDGENLLVREKRGPIYSETMMPREGYNLAALRSLIDFPRHYIEAPRVESYDLQRDPGETRDLGHVDEMAKVLARYGEGRLATAGVSDERAEALASLGYVGGGSVRVAGGANPRDHVREIEALLAAINELGHGDTDDLARRILAGMTTLGVQSEQLHRMVARKFLAVDRADLAARMVPSLAGSADVESVVLAGEVAFETGRAEEAARLFERALSLKADHPRALVGLGLVALQRGALGQADGLLTRGLALDDHIAEGWTGLGVLRARQAQVQDAVTAWEKAVALDPRASDAWFDLGVTRARSGDRTGAVKALDAYARLERGAARDRALVLIRQLSRP